MKMAFAKMSRPIKAINLLSGTTQIRPHAFFHFNHASAIVINHATNRLLLRSMQILVRAQFQRSCLRTPSPILRLR